MIPQSNQNVVLILSPSLVKLSGTVISWSKEEIILKSLTGSQTIIIPKPDLLYYSITSAPTEYQKLKDKPKKTQEDISALVDLQSELKIIEREEIRERLTTHVPGSSAQQVQYDFPSFMQYTTKETSREDTNPDIELQNLFTKES